MGLAACAIAAIRGGRGVRPGVRPLVWQGIFSALYGAQLLAQSPAGFSIFPRSIWGSRGQVAAIISYLILVSSVLFWAEMSRGGLRRFLRIALLAASMNAIAGVCSVIFHWQWTFWRSNNIVAVCFLLPLAVVNGVPSLTRKYMVVPSRILAVATFVAAVVALYDNLEGFLPLPDYPAATQISFAVVILLLGYVAAEKVFADERRLLSIENELAIAREIQTSILPHGFPKLENLRIAAVYRPMTAVAGDFYEFIPVDHNRTGFLVADVAGHGVPAALIASMIKVGVHSAVSFAQDPREMLRKLNRILSGQLRDLFVTAAYLWLDTENHRGLYSAAGHPPLLLWRGGKLERIESNGVVFGAIPEPDYPVREMAISSGDRFLLYTDGVIEPKNASGESFGDRKLEQVVRSNQSRPPSELLDELLSEIRRWQPSLPQQDDITLIVIDVV